MIKRKSDFDKYLDEQLKRLGTDYIDFYLFHALNEKYWETVIKYELLECMETAVKDGRIRYTGFSFHSSFDIFKRITDYYDWDICMIQYNYLDIENQAGSRGLEYAGSKNIPVAVMEPLRGGNLVNSVPDDVCELFLSSKTKRSLAEWALGWLMDQKGINVILSGMSSLEQIRENIRIIDEHESFDDTDMEIVTRAYVMFHSRQRALCTACDYCSDCPKNIMISTILSLYDDYLIFKKQERAKKFYRGIIKAKKDISHCSECKKCEEICPQGISIVKMLKEADKILR